MEPSIIVLEPKIDRVGVFATTGFSSEDVVLSIDDSYIVDDKHPVPSAEEDHCDY